MPFLAQQRTTGDSIVIMKQVRKPKFIDNAIHIGEVQPQGDTRTKVTLRQRKTGNYALGTERAYEIIEGQDSMIIQQPQVDGHNSTNSIAYMGSIIQNDAALNKPRLIYGADNTSERLVLGSVMSSSKGTSFAVRNLKGQTLSALGFNSTSAHFGQPIDVGFRSSDMAIRLSRDIADSFTSVNTALPLSPSNSSLDRRKHSTTFVATDFYGINLVTALRFLGRHDNHVIYFDRFGNLLYVPFNFSESGREIDHNARSGPAVTNPVANISNRVIVEGKPLAVNERAYAEVNDAEAQSGRGGDIQTEAQIVSDFTVISNDGARRVARNILKVNSIMEGNKTSAGHPKAWDLRPGKIIVYEGERRILVEVRHNLARDTADLVFLSVDTGVEGVLQGILEGINNTGNRPNFIEQIVEENLSLFGKINIITIPIITIIGHSAMGGGFIIGRAMGRGIIGGGVETIRGSKATGIIQKGGI